MQSNLMLTSLPSNIGIRRQVKQFKPTKRQFAALRKLVYH
jgi:hypothetical protein